MQSTRARTRVQRLAQQQDGDKAQNYMLTFAFRTRRRCVLETISSSFLGHYGEFRAVGCGWEQKGGRNSRTRLGCSTDQPTLFKSPLAYALTTMPHNNGCVISSDKVRSIHRLPHWRCGLDTASAGHRKRRVTSGHGPGLAGIVATRLLLRLNFCLLCWVMFQMQYFGPFFPPRWRSVQALRQEGHNDRIIMAHQVHFPGRRLIS